MRPVYLLPLLALVSMQASAASAAEKPAERPLLLAQQSYDTAPNTYRRPPPQRRPERGGSSSHTNDLIGIGVGIGIGIAIDALTAPRNEPLPPLPPTSQPRQPGPRETTSPPPPRRRSPVTYVSLPDPAPLPPLRPGSQTAAQATPPGEFRAGEVLIGVTAQAGPEAPEEIAQAFDLVLLRETLIGLTGQRIVVYAIPDGRSVDAVEVALAGDPRTEAAQKNFVYRFGGDVAPGSMAAGQYALTTMHVPAAHALARGHGVTIAVIDSAVDAGHLELAGAVAGSFDAAGYGIAGADHHGTSVAGIIAARGGLVGVAPGASLLAVRAFWREAEGGAMTSSSEVIARAIDWAVENGAQVLNLSFTGPRDPLIAEMLQVARNRGVIPVAAAGNAGPGAPPLYPAALDGVVAVTATDAENGLFDLANRGAYVDIAAPGVDILSPAPDNGYQVISGTSMATAQVSGLAALLIEARADARPDVDAALEAFAAGARDLGEPGRDPEFGAGLADAQAMLTGGPSATAAQAR